MTDMTHLFAEPADGRPGAADRLLTVVYDELRRLAAQELVRHGD